MTIWKFPLSIAPGSQSIMMPAGSAVLCVQVQHEVPWIWVEVDPEARLIRRRFRVYGTGHPIDEEGLGYVGTFQVEGGEFVFHLFTDPKEMSA